MLDTNNGNAGFENHHPELIDTENIKVHNPTEHQNFKGKNLQHL